MAKKGVGPTATPFLAHFGVLRSTPFFLSFLHCGKKAALRYNLPKFVRIYAEINGKFITLHVLLSLQTPWGKTAEVLCPRLVRTNFLSVSSMTESSNPKFRRLLRILSQSDSLFDMFNGTGEGGNRIKLFWILSCEKGKIPVAEKPFCRVFVKSIRR